MLQQSLTRACRPLSQTRYTIRKEYKLRYFSYLLGRDNTNGSDMYFEGMKIELQTLHYMIEWKAQPNQDAQKERG